MITITHVCPCAHAARSSAAAKYECAEGSSAQLRFVSCLTTRSSGDKLALRANEECVSRSQRSGNSSSRAVVRLTRLPARVARTAQAGALGKSRLRAQVAAGVCESRATLPLLVAAARRCAPVQSSQSAAARSLLRVELALPHTVVSRESSVRERLRNEQSPAVSRAYGGRGKTNLRANLLATFLRSR